MDTEYLFMLPKTWLEYQQYEDAHVAINKNLYNAYCRPKSSYVEKYSEIWDPKIHSPCNYFQNFYVVAPIEEFRNEKHYVLAIFRNGI